MLVAFNRFFDRRGLSSIRMKISERHSGRVDCLEGEAKRTSVRERRLKGKMPPRVPRSVRTPHTRKARSSERACKRKTGTVSRACRHSNWRRSGDSESRCARFTSSAKASSRFAENSPPGCFPGANRPHRFESPLRFLRAKQNRHGFPCLRHFKTGGEVGIRTPDTLVGYTHLAGEHLRPLGHFSARDAHFCACRGV